MENYKEKTPEEKELDRIKYIKDKIKEVGLLEFYKGNHDVVEEYILNKLDEDEAFFKEKIRRLKNGENKV